MNRQKELFVVTLLLLLAAGLRFWDLTRLPPGFSTDELAYIRMTEMVHGGKVALFYQVGDGNVRTVGYAVVNALVTELVGDGFLGYRALALGGGLVTLAMLYLLTRRLFGPYVALIALGAMSVNLRAVLLARTATAESFVPLYTLVTLLCMVIAVHLRERIRFRAPATLPFALVAALFGSSGTLHYTALVLGPLGAAFFVHLMITHQPLSRRMWSAATFVIVLATVVATPFVISTLRTPSTSQPYILWAQRPDSVATLIDGALRAVGGVIWQGDAQVTQNVPDTPLVGPVMSCLLMFGVITAVRRWREPRYTLVLLTLLAGLATDAWIDPESNFAANLVALPAVYILLGIGAVAVWRALRDQGMQRAWQPIVIGLVLMLAANVISVQNRLFDSWHNDDEVAAHYHASLGHLAAYLDRHPDGPPVSLCMMYLNRPNAVGLSPRQVLPLMMHRDDLPIRSSDCRSGLVFINAGAEMRFIFLDPPRSNEVRTQIANRWPVLAAYVNAGEPVPADVLAELPDVPFYLTDWLAAGGPVPIEVLYTMGGMRPELAQWLVDGEPLSVPGLPDDSVLLVDVEQRIADTHTLWRERDAFFLPEQNSGINAAMVPVRFEYNLSLAGYELGGGRVPGDDANPIIVTTYWVVDGVLPPDLGLSAFLMSFWEPQPGRRVPDTGTGPRAEAHAIDVIPTELRERDLFAQVLYVSLPATLEAEEYALLIGAYNGHIANRLGVLEKEVGGRRRKDLLWLGQVQLEPPVEPAGNGP